MAKKAGIVSLGAYIPFYRLSNDEIGKVWGSFSGKGEKAVSGADEDSITMAVEACRDCLASINSFDVDGLFFASTTPPYLEKQSASIIAAALNLRKDIQTVDFGQSLRSATCALKTALDAVNSSSKKLVLVVTAETPLGPPNSARELEFGDGAAALLIGTDNIIAEFAADQSISSELLDRWRLPDTRFSQEWEDRFIRDTGYMRLLPEAVELLFNKIGLKANSINKAVYNGFDARSHRSIAKKIGFDYISQVQDPLYDLIGNCWAASSFITLISALEISKQGELLLLANYGDGADCFILKVIHEFQKPTEYRGINGYLKSKMYLPTYGNYLRFRNLMEWEVDRRPPPRTSLPHYYRESMQIYGLVGQECNNCGHQQFPRQKICMWCQAKLVKPENYEDVQLSKQRGRLFTYSMDERAPVADLPNVICVVDLEEGARFYGLMTDRNPSELAIGQEMEFTFRKINDAQGVHNYFWKVRPVRNSGGFESGKH